MNPILIFLLLFILISPVSAQTGSQPITRGKLTTPLDANLKSITNAGTIISTNFAGNAAGVSNVPAAKITGTAALPDYVLSTNVLKAVSTNDSGTDYRALFLGDDKPGALYLYDPVLERHFRMSISDGFWNFFGVDVLANSFSGDGQSLTNLGAGNLAGGFVPDARLASNIVRYTSGILTSTNAVHKGTNWFPAGSSIAFERADVTSLANGANAAVPLGTNVFVELSGNSSDASLCGLDGQPNRDGDFRLLLYRQASSLTFAHDSGLDPTPANRLRTPSGLDVTSVGPCAALMIYSGAQSRWQLLSLQSALDAEVRTRSVLVTNASDSVRILEGDIFASGNITSTGTMTAAQFIGDGSLLTGVIAQGTNVPADTITGTLPDARLSTNVAQNSAAKAAGDVYGWSGSAWTNGPPSGGGGSGDALLDGTNTWTGPNTFTQPITTPTINTTNVIADHYFGDFGAATNLNGAHLQAGTVNSNALDAATQSLLGGAAQAVQAVETRLLSIPATERLASTNIHFYALGDSWSGDTFINALLVGEFLSNRVRFHTNLAQNGIGFFTDGISGGTNIMARYTNVAKAMIQASVASGAEVIVSVLVGLNDGMSYAYTPAPSWVLAWSNLVQSLRDDGAKVLAYTIPASALGGDVQPGAWYDVTRLEKNHEIRKAVDKNGNRLWTWCADLAEVFNDARGFYYSADRLHLNNAGEVHKAGLANAALLSGANFANEGPARNVGALYASVIWGDNSTNAAAMGSINFTWPNGWTNAGFITIRTNEPQGEQVGHAGSLVLVTNGTLWLKTNGVTTYWLRDKTNWGRVIVEGQANATTVFESGTVPTARLGSGSASASTYLRGDQTWATPAGEGGGVSVAAGTNVTAVTNGSLVTLSAAYGTLNTNPVVETLSVTGGGSNVLGATIFTNGVYGDARALTNITDAALPSTITRNPATNYVWLAPYDGRDSAYNAVVTTTSNYYGATLLPTTCLGACYDYAPGYWTTVSSSARRFQRWPLQWVTGYRYYRLTGYWCSTNSDSNILLWRRLTSFEGGGAAKQADVTAAFNYSSTATNVVADVGVFDLGATNAGPVVFEYGVNQSHDLDVTLWLLGLKLEYW